MTKIERPSPNSARAVRAYSLPPEQVLDALVRAIEGLPRWSIASRDAKGLAAVRTTRLLRFKDDVTVGITPDGSGTKAEFSSSSRVGKGDLGQNPRNVKELLDVLDRQLEDRD